MIGGWTDIYEKAKMLDFDLTLIQEKTKIKPRDFDLADQVISCELDDPMVPDLIATIHRARPFDTVVSFQELGVMNAALAGDRLGIASNPLTPVLLACDKGKMREHMAAAGLPSIPYVVASCAEDVIGFASACGWPVILKPTGGNGSQQIHKLYSKDAVPAAYASIVEHFPGVLPIAEKFMVGPEVSVEGFSWGGVHTILGVTDKITSGAPFFVETGHNMPSALPAETVEAIKDMTATFLASIGHMHGPSHTEIIVTDEGPIIIESHTRTGGDRIFEMVELVHGVDMIGATLEGFAGQTPKAAVKQASGAAIRYLTLPEGKISSISGLEQARASEGVVRCDIELQAGTEIHTFKNSTERYGYILAVGDSREAAVANVERAMQQIQIVIA